MRLIRQRLVPDGLEVHLWRQPPHGVNTAVPFVIVRHGIWCVASAAHTLRKVFLLVQIVLSTLNARYSHSSFGLRYLLANMGDLQPQTSLLEFTISDNTSDMLSSILAQIPHIVGFGVYIWNVEQTARLIADLKRVQPHTIIIFDAGGQL